MGENSRFVVPNEDLFWLHTCQFLDTFINIPRNQIFVATVYFGVGFFYQGNPQLVKISAPAENWNSRFLVDWDSLIHDDVNPLEILEESQNI